MKELKGKVAVVTGAASGIGRALAERSAQEGMKVVLADIEEAALAQAERELRAAGASVLAVRTDVSKADDIAALAQKTLDAFGAVHLLFNNAGVSAGTTVWESTQADWEWVIGVNLWSVIHATRIFVPLMLAQESECHIVNTASVAGLVSGPGLGVYKVTKHGVVTLSETLQCELVERGSKIKVSLLCPGWVNTRIMESGRNRPGELQNAPGSVVLAPETKARIQEIAHAVQSGSSPQQVAQQVFDAVKKEQFYILTHPEWKPLIRQRMENILNEESPA